MVVPDLPGHLQRLTPQVLQADVSCLPCCELMWLRKSYIFVSRLQHQAEWQVQSADPDVALCCWHRTLQLLGDSVWRHRVWEGPRSHLRVIHLLHRWFSFSKISKKGYLQREHVALINGLWFIIIYIVFINALLSVIRSVIRHYNSEVHNCHLRARISVKHPFGWWLFNL